MHQITKRECGLYHSYFCNSSFYCIKIFFIFFSAPVAVRPTLNDVSRIVNFSLLLRQSGQIPKTNSISLKSCGLSLLKAVLNFLPLVKYLYFIFRITPTIDKEPKKITHPEKPRCVIGALEETRTPDLLIRSQTLYPAELPAHMRLIINRK